MELEEVEVTIDADGKVHIHVRGVKGPACLELTQALEAALGSQVETRQMTPEALESPVDDQQDVHLPGEHSPGENAPLRRSTRTG